VRPSFPDCAVLSAVMCPCLRHVDRRARLARGRGGVAAETASVDAGTAAMARQGAGLGQDPGPGSRSRVAKAVPELTAEAMTAEECS